MSGFEVVGVVLGAFPLLITGAKALKRAVEGSDEWWRFERRFEEFINDVEFEYITFSQVFHNLFDSSPDLSPAEIDSLRSQPTEGAPVGLSWHSEHVKRAIDRRLNREYQSWFIFQANRVSNALGRLQELLPISQAHLIDGSCLESTKFRVIFSYSVEKVELLSVVSKGNGKLHDVLNRVSNVGHTEKESGSIGSHCDQILSSIVSSQVHARIVSNGLQKHWLGDCNCAEGRHCLISTDGTGFHILFGEQGASKQINVRLATHDPGDAGRVGTTTLESVTQLREEASLKSTYKKATGKVAGAVLQMTHGITNPTPNDARPKSSLKREPAKLQKRNVPPSRPPVRFSQPSGPAATSPATTRPRAIGEDHWIPDVCTTMGGGTTANCLGYLGESATKLLFHHHTPQSGSSASDPASNTIGDFIRETQRRATRLEVGLAIIENSLRLGSLWCPQPSEANQAEWHTHLLVLHRPAQPVPGAPTKPFLTRLSDHPRGAPINDTKTAQTTLLALGIVLLELFWQDSFHQQTFRQQYLGPEGQPNDMTDFSAARMWQKGVEAQLGDLVAGAIERCLNFYLDREADFGNPKFLRKIWTRVVMPLQEMIDTMNGGGR